MRRFTNILVEVDSSWCDRFVCDEPSSPNAEAVRQALWLAKLNSASVLFFSSLELSAKAQQLISESSADESTVLNEAEKRLAELVARARGEGVSAASQVAIGKTWVELIRQVQRNAHDLVLAGSRHVSATKGWFLGSTEIKLLRKCPCPVWVTRSLQGKRFDSILVAHDLRPVGDLAMQLGCSMAKLQNAQLHVIHAAEFPEFDYMLPAAISLAKKDEYRREAEEYLGSQLASADLPLPAKVDFVDEPPSIAIMDCVTQHNIDLVVMGTVGRTGISGFFTGSTAEQLLPKIPCSLLAVKPAGFSSPITLNDG